MHIQTIVRTGDRCREDSNWRRRKKSYEEVVQKHDESVVNCSRWSSEEGASERLLVT